MFGAAHLGKPQPEMIGALVGGAILGTLAWRQKSFATAFYASQPARKQLADLERRELSAMPANFAGRPLHAARPFAKHRRTVGASPSGKASVFGTDIPRFES